MITGTDDKSIKALELFSNKETVHDVVNELNISLDQAKKLSRFYTMQVQAKDLPENCKIKLKALGIKSLVLAPLFKENDLKGIQEILESIPLNIRRSDLQKMPSALKEKRKHLEKVKSSIVNSIEELNSKEITIEKKLRELRINKQILEDSVFFLKLTSKETGEFLTSHLGFFRNKLVLFKRLDICWQKDLKAKKILFYNNQNKTWEVKDMQALISETESRIKNKSPLYYDYTKSDKLFSNNYPLEAEYENVQKINIDITEIIKKNEEELKYLEKEKLGIKKFISEAKRKSPRDFLQAAVIVNEISKKDIETHAVLQNKAMRWLYDNNYVCSAEIVMENCRFDAAGYNQNNNVVIIEAKSNVDSLKKDNKWHSYLKYCNDFYFIFNDLDFNFNIDFILSIAKDKGAGLLVVRKNKIELILENIQRDETLEKEKLIFNIARSASRKIIYGY